MPDTPRDRTGGDVGTWGHNIVGTKKILGSAVLVLKKCDRASLLLQVLLEPPKDQQQQRDQREHWTRDRRHQQFKEVLANWLGLSVSPAALTKIIPNVGFETWYVIKF